MGCSSADEAAAPAAAVVAEIKRQVRHCLQRSGADGGGVHLRVKGLPIAAMGLFRKRSAGGDTGDSGSACEAAGRMPALGSTVLRVAFDELCGAGPLSSHPKVVLAGLELRNAQLSVSDVGERSGESTPGKATVCSLLFSPQVPWSSQVGTSLTVLDLESNPLGDEGVQAICDALLPRLPHLARLHLASTEVTMSGLYALVEALCGVSESRGGGGGEHTETTSSLLCPSLAVVGLTNNPLDIAEEVKTGRVTTGQLLARLARAHQATLQRLHLNHAGLTTDDAVLLLREVILCKQPGLYVNLDLIYLKQNTNVDAAVLREALGCGDTLRRGLSPTVPTHRQQAEELLAAHVML